MGVYLYHLLVGGHLFGRLDRVDNRCVVVCGCVGVTHSVCVKTWGGRSHSYILSQNMKDTPEFVDSLGCRAEYRITPYGINYEFFIISVYVDLWVKMCEKAAGKCVQFHKITAESECKPTINHPLSRGDSSLSHSLRIREKIRDTPQRNTGLRVPSGT